MKPMKHSRTIVLTALCLFAGSASAHTGNHLATGFTGGLAHPFLGLDHLLAMIAIGLWAAQQGGRALWAVPAAFVGTGGDRDHAHGGSLDGVGRRSGFARARQAGRRGDRPRIALRAGRPAQPHPVGGASRQGGGRRAVMTRRPCLCQARELTAPAQGPTAFT